MRECSKSIGRRQHDPNFVRKYIVGDGVDIGGKPDPLELYLELFPLCRSVRTWDSENGDAQQMEGVADESYDFVFSSHCLEHILNPAEALGNWIRIVKPGGYIVITVPDEDLYEQKVFPSTFNRDHKWTFTTGKTSSWSEKSISLTAFLQPFFDRVHLIKLEEINYDYRYELPRYDRTMTPVGEAAIEIILRKLLLEHDKIGQQPPAHLRAHYNQYRLDRRAMIQQNERAAPFSDDSEL